MFYSENYVIDTYASDANEMVKPSGVIQMMQAAGDGQMCAERPSYSEILEQGITVLLNRLDLNILTEVKRGDEVKVVTWPCPGKRVVLPRIYEMWRDGQKVAEVSSQWSAVNIEERKILSSDQVDFSNYTMGEFYEAAEGRFKIPSDVEAEMETAAVRKVGYSNSDCNGHMNNTYYLDFFCDEIPELEAGTHRVSTVRIHFMKEAMVGNKLTIKRSKKMAPREGADHEARYMFKSLLEDGTGNVAAEIGILPVNK